MGERIGERKKDRIEEKGYERGERIGERGNDRREEKG